MVSPTLLLEMSVAPTTSSPVSAIDAIIDERRNTQARAAAIAQRNVLAFPGEVGWGRSRGDDITSIEEGERGDRSSPAEQVVVTILLGEWSKCSVTTFTLGIE